MLARIAQELFWLGRNLARAEQTSRLLDGVFQADLQGRPEDPSAARLSWDALLLIMGAGREAGGPTHRDEAIDALTLDPTTRPRSSRASRGRATARAPCATSSPPRCGRRSTPPTCGCATAASSARLHIGPSSIYQDVKERSALFWGLTARTMLRDEASAFLNAGGRIEAGDMVLRMLRVALPPGERRPSADGQAIALLHAVGGFQAYRRAVPAPPHADAGGALPALRAQLSRTRWRPPSTRSTARC